MSYFFEVFRTNFVLVNFIFELVEDLNEIISVFNYCKRSHPYFISFQTSFRVNWNYGFVAWEQMKYTGEYFFKVFRRILNRLNGLKVTGFQLILNKIYLFHFKIFWCDIFITLRLRIRISDFYLDFGISLFALRFNFFFFNIYYFYWLFIIIAC